MNIAKEKRFQSWAAIAILVAAAGILLAATALPLWLANVSQKEEVEQLHERLQRLNQVAGMDADLRPKYSELRESQLSNGHYLRSDTVAVAGAELQRIVKNIAAANQTQLISTQILPSSSEAGFIRIGLKVHLRGSLKGVLQSIYEIETGEVFLFPENLSLRDSGIRPRPRQIVKKQMDATFELVGYMPDIS
jgi:hypothetical protein